ncbi:MAG: coproporphyrinogen III oxidase family protein, partial [Candidatus Hydrogenedentota bacterium]
YCLTFEPPTPLWQLSQGGKIERKTGEEEVEFSEIAREMLTNAGYEHYEISNFALPGRHSFHNSVYWSNEEYLGFGASAVSYIGSRRITNLREPAAYVRAVESRASAADEVEEIPPHMQAVETIIQRLRLRKGIDCTAFRARFGFHPGETFGDSLQGLVELGLLEDDGFTIKSSLKGWHLANEIALKLLA